VVGTTVRAMSQSTIHPFEDRFEQAWPALGWRDTHVVLAISGGADSVAMLRAAEVVKRRRGGNGKLFVAHLNHSLRGCESDADAEWIADLCRQLGIPSEIGKCDLAAIAENQGDGMEAAARTARYDFLRHAAERVGARYVAVAHTADDQIETVLHRILRGTAIAGLCGIPRSRPLARSVSLIRPLLNARRREVLEYLEAIGQSFRTDNSNADTRWTRNRLRHELLPTLRDVYNADIDAALLRLAAQASESQKLIAHTASQLAIECVTIEYGTAPEVEPRQAIRVRIDAECLTNQPPLIAREVCKTAWESAGWRLQAMGFEQWQQLAEFAAGENTSPAVHLPGGVRARRDGRHLILQICGLP